MPSAPRLDLVTAVDRMVGDGEEDTRLLREMYEAAMRFMRSHDWCPPIVHSYLGYGVGGVVAVFLFEMEAPLQGRDRYLWCVVGDLPSAYVVVDRAATPTEALLRYCELMEDWSHSVLRGESVADRFPVHVPATEANARQLLTRTGFLRERIIPEAEGAG